MNFISDQEGIMNRYLREKDHWKPHLDNTRQFILDSFLGKEINSIAVMGSGWLLDLPIEELSKKYKKVLLLDVFHPPQVVKKCSKLKNVTLFECDLTGGGIDFCWELRKKKGEHFESFILDKFKPAKPELPYTPDAYISLNILNQLDIILVDFLEKKNRRITDMEIRRFRKKIQKFHVDWLSEKPACLVTDVTEMVSSAEDETQEKNLIHAELPEGQRNAEWIWDFDLSQTYRKNKETRMKVHAIEW